MGKRGIFKHDYEAQKLWGAAYSSIPKSVFAVIAWYLADICSEAGADNGGAERRFVEELDAMASNGILSAAQCQRARAAVQRMARP